MSKELKRFLYTASVESTSGYQTFYIDAETREEADERARSHDTDGIYWEEVEVQDLGRLSFDDETRLDDFGKFPLESAQSSQQGAVAWQVRRADGRIDGVPIQWESCTEELYDATLATGRYAGYENGPKCEVRALYTHPHATDSDRIRREALEEAVKVCHTKSDEYHTAYKRSPVDDPRRGNPYVEGMSDGCSNCADAIRALSQTPAPGGE